MQGKTLQKQLLDSVDYIFISFGIIEPILVILKIKSRLSGC